MKKALTLFVLSGLACTGSFAQGHSVGPAVKISKDLQAIDPNSDVDVIVQFKTRPTAEHFNKVHSLGGIDKRIFNKVPGAAFRMHASTIQTLANDPDVAYVSIDRPVHSHLDLSAATINAPLVWNQNYVGTGIGVAVIDSGIDASQRDLGNAAGQTGPGQSRVVHAENFLVPATNPNGQPNPAFYQTHDGYGHGTHVAGIIAGNGSQSTGPNFITTFKGIAPQANLIDLQVLDASGSGTDSDVIAAIEEAINLKSTYNIKVINLSLGRPVYESFAVDPLCQAVEQAWQAGIVVVVAAGNDGRDDSFGNNGYGTIDAPGNDPYVLTVGAMNVKLTGFRGDDVITTYSSKGPTPVDHVVKPDIMAPGNHISSLLSNGTYLAQTYPSDIVNPLAYQTQNGPSNYLILNGTSMATGVVSGAVADLLCARPNLTPDQAKSILMLTASKQFNTYTNSYYSFASLTYETHMQLMQDQQNLQADQQALQQATNQLQNAQNQLNNAKTLAQAATTAYNAAAQASTQLTTALATAQTLAATLAQASTAAQRQLTAANAAQQQAQAKLQADQQALNNAQAALQSAQHPPAGAASSAVAVQAAQAAFQAAQLALIQAQQSVSAANNAQQVAQQNQQKAQQAAQQAANTVQQLQNQLNQANNQVQQTNTQLTQANTNLNNATTAAQQAQQTITTDQQTVASDQALIAALQVPAATQAGQLAEMQTDPEQYTPTQYDAFSVGAGYLDLNAAITGNVAPPNGPALSPVAYIDPATGLIYATAAYGEACGNPALGGSAASPLYGAAFCTPASLGNAIGLWDFSNGQVGGQPNVWGNQSVWGSRSVWGASLVGGPLSTWGSSSSQLTGQSYVNGERSVWGASATQAYSTLWADRSVWGASISGAASTDSASNILTSGDH